MTRLHDALEGIAEQAPEIAVRRGLYRSARRRRRVKMALSVVAVIALVAAIAPVSKLVGRAESAAGGDGPPGLPSHVTMPPSSTSVEPAGPASVVFTGEDMPQADNEDVKMAWWRSGYTVYPSVTVGLTADTYRIVRGGYSVGTELSPDGRYMLVTDRKVLDLTTGKTRQLLPEKPEWEVSGVWSADGRRIVFVEDRVTTILSWPSLAVEARFRHPDQVPVNRDVALSPDGSLLAVNSNQMLSLYRPDGTRVWTTPEEGPGYPELGRLRVAGKAAWTADGRLALFGRTDLTCDDCGVHPGTWRLRFLGVTGGNPVLLEGPSYPAVRSATDVSVVAWRGDVAYAVVSYSGPTSFEPGRVDLVRLRPGTGDPELVLTAPGGASWMEVATDYLGVTRPTGEPMYGSNPREVIGKVTTGILCVLPFLALVGVALRLRRRSHIRPAIFEKLRQ